MSLCSRPLGALSRSRVPPPSRTLAPFLYQTATIQRWKSAGPPLARRAASSRPGLGDDIPFADDALPSPVGKAESGRRTTMTGSERAAFEQLYKKFSPSQDKPRDDSACFESEADQIADEYYEDDMDENDASAASLDSLFDAVLHASPGLADSHKQHEFRKKDKVKKQKWMGKRQENLATLAQEILRPELDEQKSKNKEAAKKEAGRIKSIMLEEREKVDALLRGAQTDRDVWQVLETDVFSLIRSLDLDGMRESSREQTCPAKKRNKEPKISTHPAGMESDTTAPAFPNTPTNELCTSAKVDPMRSDPRILFPNYPHHLVIAVQVLRTHFPASPLPLSIIPTIKSLGRSSYALGATTLLYKHLLYAAWLQHSSYSLIAALLEDMDSGGIEFDYGILNMLEAVLREYHMGRAGKLGRNLQVIMDTEQTREEIKKLSAWKDVASQRLGVWGNRQAEQGALVRKYDPTSRTKRSGVTKGPRDKIELRGTNPRTLAIAYGRGLQDLPIVKGTQGDVGHVVKVEG